MVRTLNGNRNTQNPFMRGLQMGEDFLAIGEIVGVGPEQAILQT